MRNTGPTGKVRALVFERAARNGRALCERCGGARVEQLHHRRARALGGSRRDSTNEAPNLIGLCTRCHAQVESHRADAYENGWLVRQSAAPADVPVRVHDRGLVFLDTTGGYGDTHSLGVVA